jgi:hypothetical protein
MSYRKSRRLAGVLAAAVLGVLAFASSAQAITELGSGFFIGGAQAGALLATLSGKQTSAVSSFLIPALKLEINCTGFSVVSGAIESTTLAEGKLLFEGCTVLTNEKNAEGKTVLAEAFGCEIVVNHTGDNRHHITATGKILPAELTDGSPAVLLEGTKNVLTAEGKGCLLPKTTVVKGEICLKVLKNHTAEPEFESSEAIQKSCNPRLTLEGIEFSGTLADREKLEAEGKGFLDKVLFGINESFLDIKASLFATGAHALKTLGVLLI